MIRKYIYQEQEYFSSYSVRQAIWKNEGKVFSAEPEQGKAEFWAALGVTYTEEPDPVPEPPTVEEVRAQKLDELEKKFLQWYEQDATLVSSLGYECDSAARAMLDISGLVIKAEADGVEKASTYSTTFMDANNQPHLVGTEQLKTIQLEIVSAGQAAYQEKWTMRSQILAAENAEDLEAFEIAFTKQDFSKVTEDAAS